MNYFSDLVQQFLRALLHRFTSSQWIETDYCLELNDRVVYNNYCFYGFEKDKSVDVSLLYQIDELSCNLN